MLCRCQDVNGGRRRLTLSTLLSTPLKTPSHAKYPLTRLQQQVVRKAQVRFTGRVLPVESSDVALAVAVSLLRSGVAVGRHVVRADV